MARAQGARALMALAFETTYGTPPAGGFTKMPFASTSLGAEQPLLNSELLGYGRDPLAPIKDAVTWALGVGTEAGWRTHLDAASITRVVIGPHGPLLRSFNETGHLGRKPGAIRITG